MKRLIIALSIITVVLFNGCRLSSYKLSFSEKEKQFKVTDKCSFRYNDIIEGKESLNVSSFKVKGFIVSFTDNYISFVEYILDFPYDFVINSYKTQSIFIERTKIDDIDLIKMKSIKDNEINYLLVGYEYESTKILTFQDEKFYNKIKECMNK